MSNDLRQADLSRLSVKDMTTAQRAEMRRRYEAFITGMKSVAAPMPKSQPKKWVPGAAAAQYAGASA